MADQPEGSLALQVFQHHFHRIASFTTLLTARYLSQVHQSLHHQLGVHVAQSFYILLSKYISSPNISRFRSLLREARVAISGSTVLHFVMRDEHWHPGDIDLYAPFGVGYFVVHWLTKHEGYEVVADGTETFTRRPRAVGPAIGVFSWLTDFDLNDIVVPQRPWTDKYMTGRQAQIYRVYKLRRKDSEYAIDIIESSRPSFLPTITRFHSTLVMNYITADSVVVLYPSLTFRRQAILQHRNEVSPDMYDKESGEVTLPPPTSPSQAVYRSKNREYLQKYILRRFKLYIYTADLRKPCGAACPALVRDAHDRWTLEIEFGDNMASTALDGIAAHSPDGTALANQPNPGLPSTQTQTLPSSSVSPTAHGISPDEALDPSLGFTTPPSESPVTESSPGQSPVSWSSTLLCLTPIPFNDPELPSDTTQTTVPSLPIRPPVPTTLWSLSSRMYNPTGPWSRNSLDQTRKCKNPHCALYGQQSIRNLPENWPVDT